MGPTTDVQARVRERGYWHSPGGLCKPLLEFACKFGVPVPVRPTEPASRILTPTRRENASPRSLSSAHGLGRFPFHTDAAHHMRPPRWLVMRCIDPGPLSRPTYLIDWLGHPLSEHEQGLLERAVWRVRSGPAPFLTSVMACSHTGEMILRYDPGCMEPADPAFRGAAEMLERLIATAERVEIDWSPGDVLVIDNWRMLHARGDGTTEDEGLRRLERVLVQIDR